MSEGTYRWKIQVRQYNTYGDRVTNLIPTTILAKDRLEVTEKVHAAFNAKYDEYRKNWSHDWLLESMDEVGE